MHRSCFESKDRILSKLILYFSNPKIWVTSTEDENWFWNYHHFELIMNGELQEREIQDQIKTSLFLFSIHVLNFPALEVPRP